jgi:hypothetical protein
MEKRKSPTTAHRRRDAGVVASSGPANPPYPPRSDNTLMPGPFQQPQGIPPVLRQSLQSGTTTGVSSSSNLTLTPVPVNIVPTSYPDNPSAPLVVKGAITIDVRTEAYQYDIRRSTDGTETLE